MKRPTLNNMLGLLLAGTIALLGHSAAVAQPVPPAKDESGWVTLVFAGDIVLDDVAGAMIERGEDPRAALAHGGGHHLVVDDDDAQVLPFAEPFEQHALAEAAGVLDRGLHLLDRGEVDRDALALLAVHRLHHDGAVFAQDLLIRNATVHTAAARGSLEHSDVLVQGGVIRAVGPGVWNGWKGQLLRTLYYETELLLSGGFSQVSRKERAKHAAEQLTKALEGWSQKDQRTYTKLHYEPYLLSVDLEDQVRHAHFIRQTDKSGQALATMVRTHQFHAITEITVLSPDHPRLLSIIAGACAAAGANIADAQIFTTSDGRALDTILINREFPIDEDETRRAATIGKMIEDVLSGRKRLPEVIATRSKGKKKNKTFPVQPDVRISNALSNKFTVIEVMGLDRTGLLHQLTREISDLNLTIGSAHIGTYGEKAVDVFYVTDLTSAKIKTPERLAEIEAALLAAASDQRQQQLEKA